MGTPVTREDLYQTSIEVRSTPAPTGEPIFTIFGKVLPRRCETKDSTLICALIFIDKSLGYKISDVNYIKYFLLVNNVLDDDVAWNWTFASWTLEQLDYVFT